MKISIQEHNRGNGFSQISLLFSSEILDQKIILETSGMLMSLSESGLFFHSFDISDENLAQLTTMINSEVVIRHLDKQFNSLKQELKNSIKEKPSGD